MANPIKSPSVKHVDSPPKIKEKVKVKTPRIDATKEIGEGKAKKSSKTFAAQILSGMGRVVRQTGAVFRHLLCCCFTSSKPTDIERAHHSDKSASEEKSKSSSSTISASSKSHTSVSKSKSASASVSESELTEHQLESKKIPALQGIREMGAPLNLEKKVERRGDHLLITYPNYPLVELWIRHEDMFDAHAEVLVNAANKKLQIGIGIDGMMGDFGVGYKAMHEAGRELNFKAGDAFLIPEVEFRWKLDDEKKKVKESDSKGLGEPVSITRGVLVTAAVRPKKGNEEKRAPAIFSCYRNCVELLVNKGYTSAAFSAIATGVFRFPLEEGAKLAIQAFEEEIAELPEDKKLTLAIHLYPDKQQVEHNLSCFQKAVAATSPKSG